MTTFLQKLKEEGVSKAETTAVDPSKDMVAKGVVKLDVDVYQTASHFVLYAQVPGAELDNIDVSIEGDSDILNVQGKKIKPEKHVFPGGNMPEGKYFAEECQWGEFYRQIIFPERIDATQAEAKLRNGVLILVLPILHATGKKIKVEILEAKDGQG